MNRNHVNFQKRIDFIVRLLSEQYKIENADISPVEYDPECPFRYNNFVYKITFSPTTFEDTPKPAGCAPIPDGTTSFIMRLTNPEATGMNRDNRVENEVAIINLMSAALSRVGMDVVPSVFGWGSAAGKSSQGWILQRLMPGTPLDAAFKSMDRETKRVMFTQMATMLSAIQNHQLPERLLASGD